MYKSKTKGFTLLEMILTIVLVGTVLVGMVTILSDFIPRSIVPIHQEKSFALVQGYIEEILSKDFLDPETSLACDPSDAGEGTSRTDFDDMCDYDGLDEIPHDYLGNAIADYDGHEIEVEVDNTVSLDGVSGGTTIMRIIVIGKFQNIETTRVTRYATNI